MENYCNTCQKQYKTAKTLLTHNERFHKENDIKVDDVKPQTKSIIKNKNIKKSDEKEKPSVVVVQENVIKKKKSVVVNKEDNTTKKETVVADKEDNTTKKKKKETLVVDKEDNTTKKKEKGTLVATKKDNIIKKEKKEKIPDIPCQYCERLYYTKKRKNFHEEICHLNPINIKPKSTFDVQSFLQSLNLGNTPKKDTTLKTSEDGKTKSRDINIVTLGYKPEDLMNPDKIQEIVMIAMDAEADENGIVYVTNPNGNKNINL
jgi:hypothetical protein